MHSNDAFNAYGNINEILASGELPNTMQNEECTSSNEYICDYNHYSGNSTRSIQGKFIYIYINPIFL